MFVVNDTLWKLQFVHPGDARLRRADGSATLGVCDNNVKTIFVNKILDGFMLDKVITHELVHVFCFEYGIDLDVETEEILADFLATYGRNVIHFADELLRDLLNVA